MIFHVIDRGVQIPAGSVSSAYLEIDFWDDWSSYRTQFLLTIFDNLGQQHRVGSVKIGHIGLQAGNSVGQNTRAPNLNSEFEELPQGYFSLGQDETYYETLNTLPGNLRLSVLNGLRDVAYDLELFNTVRNENVMTRSLLRGHTASNIQNRFHRLATGNAVLTAFQFEYLFPVRITLNVPPPPPTLHFLVTPNSLPPSNVHVLIGRNGVGKTTCMQNIGRALLGVDDVDNPPGRIRQLGDDQEDWSFSGLVSISFSAFDDFDLPVVPNQGMITHRVGLRYRSDNDDEVKIKTPEQLAEDFVRSFQNCRTGLRAERFLKAVRTLANDPLFDDANVPALLELDDAQWEAHAKHFYSRLSSGHKIVLLTITRLVELVDERTLVLIDEPEGHLHPPLLSAFIRSLADLLIQRNGVAIIATHSPVVLQEVPSSCVWMLRRSGSTSIAEQPTLETFGENVGILTREVFGLEVTTAGFHKLLTDAVMNSQLTYDQIVEHFNSELGAEGRAIARGLIANRDLVV